jgi:NADP-dependent 3-hydroxy acid dehydrogenase YdfG
VALAKRGDRVVLLGRRLETLEARVDSIRVALAEAQTEDQDTDIAKLVVDFSDIELGLATLQSVFANYSKWPTETPKGTSPT